MLRTPSLIGASAAATLVIAGVAAAGPSATPKLTVVTPSPVVVAGSGFRGGETVRVSIRGEDVAAKSVIASAAGRILVRFGTLKLGACSSDVIAARGDEGSRARLVIVPGACGVDP